MDLALPTCGCSSGKRYTQQKTNNTNNKNTTSESTQPSQSTEWRDNRQTNTQFVQTNCFQHTFWFAFVLAPDLKVLSYIALPTCGLSTRVFEQRCAKRVMTSFIRKWTHLTELIAFNSSISTCQVDRIKKQQPITTVQFDRIKTKQLTICLNTCFPTLTICLNTCVLSLICYKQQPKQLTVYLNHMCSVPHLLKGTTKTTYDTSENMLSGP